MKIVGYLMQYNESSRGNLHRCLENLATYCDEIVVYDDASTDDSLSVIDQYTDHIIEGTVNDFRNETSHRQQLLELALSLSPDYVFWLDADETLDRGGTEGGLRALCEKGGSWSFREVNLWRSTAWQRKDYLGNGVFTRLWKNTGDLNIKPSYGLHKQLYPLHLGPTQVSDIQVIHYGYATKEAIERRWVERTELGVPTGFRRQGIDETNMVLEPVSNDIFPKPQPVKYHPMIMKHAGLL